jgi:hypothetical protein
MCSIVILWVFLVRQRVFHQLGFFFVHLLGKGAEFTVIGL